MAQDKDWRHFLIQVTKEMGIFSFTANEYLHKSMLYRATGVSDTKLPVY